MYTDYRHLNSKHINAKDKSLVFGYLKESFDMFNIRWLPDEILFATFAYYLRDCDIFTSFCSKYSLSADKKCISGCAFGDIEINASNHRYNRYQWLLKINKLSSCNMTIGIVSVKDTNHRCWWLNENIYHYEFCSLGIVKRNIHITSQKNINAVFYENDTILLDLNTKKKTLILWIDNEFNGIHQNINCDPGISYNLAVYVHSCDYISMVRYHQFDDNWSCNKSINARKEYKFILKRYHPAS
eukprot:473694_1